jgi:hypothetical protein
MEIIATVGEPKIYYDRIRALTSPNINQKIDLFTDRNIRGVMAQGEEAIQLRLKELDKEWDIDRIFMLNFSVIVLAELLLARNKNRNWLLGPLIQTPFLLLHATLGWSPPSLLLRSMGFRTRHEIQAEREVLLNALGQ